MAKVVIPLLTETSISESMHMVLLMVSDSTSGLMATSTVDRLLMVRKMARGSLKVRI